MLRNSRIRRPVAFLLMLLGAAMMLLASETWVGVLLLALGVTIEVVGISLKHKE